VNEKGDALITDGFPEVQKKRYQLFTVACSRCHSLKRPIKALVTGRGPVTDAVFEGKEMKQHVIRMMRKRGSRITKEDALELTLFLEFARALALKPHESGEKK
jgi:hypothetical protein